MSTVSCPFPGLDAVKMRALVYMLLGVSRSGADLRDLFASGDGDAVTCLGWRDRLRPSDGDGDAHAVRVMKGIGESSTCGWCTFSALAQGVSIKGRYLLSLSSGGGCSPFAGEANVSGPSDDLLPNRLLRRLLLLPFDWGLALIDVDFVGVGGRSSLLDWLSKC